VRLAPAKAGQGGLEAALEDTKKAPWNGAKIHSAATSHKSRKEAEANKAWKAAHPAPAATP
jgi:hypothetical protein